MSAHALRGASGMYRWSVCTGSINLIERLREQGLLFEVLKPWTVEGLAAHELAARCLRTGVQALSFLGQYMLTETTPTEVDQEMADAVQVYVDHVRDISKEQGDTRYFIEASFDLSDILPGLFGTVDCAALHVPARVLHVVDYKHGEGVYVPVEGNKQLRYYALGALLKLQALGIEAMPTEVVMTIIQPRMRGAGPVIRSERILSSQLLMWVDDLIAAVKATEEPEAPLVVGDHCKFCPAATRCPAQYERNLAEAQITFKPVPRPGEADLAGPVSVNDMSQEQIRRALLVAPRIQSWLSELHAYTQALLERGEHMPGFKLVQKRADRQWNVDDFLLVAELEKWGLTRAQVFAPPKVRSPAQIEKLLPSKERKRIEPLVSRVSSGVTLAPDTDPRPAVRAALPFKAITPETPQILETHHDL